MKSPLYEERDHTRPVAMRSRITLRRDHTRPVAMRSRITLHHFFRLIIEE